MHRSFPVSRPIVLLLFVAASLWLAFAAVDRQSTHRAAEREALETAVAATRERADEIGATLAAIEDRARVLARDFAGPPASRDDIELQLQTLLWEDPRLFGAGLSFLPGRHPAEAGLYAPYAIRDDGVRLVRIEESYDYTDPGHAWFHRPLESGAGWVPVYWGEAGGSMMATYAVPVPGPGGEPMAVFNVDLALDDISTLVGAAGFGASGYGFLVDTDGKIIAHPLDSVVLERRRLGPMLDGADGETLAALQRSLENGQRYVVDAPNPVTGQPSITVIEPVPGIGWFVGASFVKAEMELAGEHALDLDLRLVAAAVTWAVSAALVWLVLGPGGDWCRRVRASAVASGVALMAGTVALWVLQHEQGLSSPYHDAIVDSEASVAAYREEIEVHHRETHRPPPAFVPTGLIVRALKMTGLNEVRATGIIWQRYPADVPGSQRGFWFPDALSSTIEEIYRTREGDVEVVGWSFDARLRQDFDNRVYPFDDIDVRLRVRPGQTLGNTVLVPDLAAYDVLIPSARPFVASNITVPGWNVAQTWFSTQGHGYGMDYGLREADTIPQVRDLVLVTSLKRDWVNNFISVIIPVFVLILLAYGAVRMTSGDPDKVRVYDFKPMRMLFLGATFCLFLILATISLRNRVVSDAIIYIEQLYFLLYFMTFVNVFIAMRIADRGHRLLAFQDGRLVKAFYLPAILAAMFVITFIAFHR